MYQSHLPNPHTVLSTPRRPTDLAALLNNDGPSEVNSPLFSPHEPTRPILLEHRSSQYSQPSPSIATPSSSTSHGHSYFPPSPVSAATSSPTFRRATDLAALLNTDMPMENNSYSMTSPLQSKPPNPLGRRPSTLSHILHPDPDVNDGVEMLQPSLSRTNTSERAQPKIKTNNLSVQNIIHPSTSPSPSSSYPSGGPSRQHSLQRIMASPQSSSRASIPVPPSAKSTTSSATSAVENHPPARVNHHLALPYAPRHRQTPPGRVLEPITPAELAALRNLGKNPLRTTTKRKRDDEGYADGGPAAKRPRDSAVVVSHYNARPDVGILQRRQSPIIGLKNFNNWVKSVLITRFAHPALRFQADSMPRRRGQVSEPPSGKVLDLGCGKGGDLMKWQKAKVRDYYGLDIAAVSVEQARSRYQSSHPPSSFHAVFNTLDCYSYSLTDAIPPSELPPASKPFDVVSMQFCMHYAFESPEKTRMMLENVTRWLRPGGVFVGTVPNASILLDNLDKLPPDTPDDELSFGNSVYRIRFDPAYRDARPLFGLRYWFFLTDAVEDVPEYIVHWDNFVKLAKEYSLRLVYKAEFHEVYQEHHTHEEFGPLLQKMHVVTAKGESQMDVEQWEAANVYIAFAFEKQ